MTPSQYNTTAGFTVDVPPGWTEKPKGLATYFYGPDDMVLDIDLSPHTYPGNMVQEAEYLEQQQAVLGDAFPGYQRAALQEVPVRGTHGAFWQFTWSLKGVKSPHRRHPVRPADLGRQAVLRGLHQGAEQRVEQQVPADLREDPADLRAGHHVVA